jgi:hypothetical protein
MNESWEEIMNYIFELDEEVAVIIGYSDIAHKENHSRLYFKDLTSESFWKVMGRGDEESVLESLIDCECNVDEEGEYEFKAILKYQKGDYSTGESGYWEIKHIEYKFTQTFLEREREWKLNEILSSDFEKLFL